MVLSFLSFRVAPWKSCPSCISAVRTMLPVKTCWTRWASQHSSTFLPTAPIISRTIMSTRAFRSRITTKPTLAPGSMRQLNLLVSVSIYLKWSVLFKKKNRPTVVYLALTKQEQMLSYVGFGRQTPTPPLPPFRFKFSKVPSETTSWLDQAWQSQWLTSSPLIPSKEVLSFHRKQQAVV